MKKPPLFLFTVHRIAEMMKNDPGLFENFGYEAFSLRDLRLIPGSKAANISRDVNQYVLRFLRAKYETCHIAVAANTGKFADRNQYFIKFDTDEPEKNQLPRRYAARMLMADVLLAEDDLAFWWDRKEKICQFDRCHDFVQGEIILGEIIFRAPTHVDGDWKKDPAKIKLFDVEELSRLCISSSGSRLGYIPLARAVNALAYRATWVGQAPDDLDRQAIAEAYVHYYRQVVLECQVKMQDYGSEFDKMKDLVNLLASAPVHSLMIYLNRREPANHTVAIQGELLTDVTRAMYYNLIDKKYWIE